MKILPFRTRLYYFLIKTLFLCYAVVNLLFSSTTVDVLGFMAIPLNPLVGSNGLGPSTSRLSGVCSNQLSYEPILGGGGNRVRTDDPLLAGQVLYQLSYTPISFLSRKLPVYKRNAPSLRKHAVY